MKPSINVGLIGYGMAGQVFHAPTIVCVPGLNLAKIRTTNPGATELARERYPDTAIVSDSNDIIHDAEIDLVVIATPNSFHYPLAQQVMEAGKNVVVDKPFTITSNDALELISLANDTGKMLSVYQNRRWDGGFLTVQKLVSESKLGRIVEAEVHFDRFRPSLKGNAWRENNEPGAGVLYDLGPHLIDEALCLFGDPIELHADVKMQRIEGVTDDYFQIDLFYNGLKVILKAGVLVKEPGPHYILHGTKGSFVKYGLDVQEAALINGLNPLNTSNWGVDPEENWGILNVVDNGLESREKIKTQTGDYAGYYQNIASVLQNDASLQVTGYDGYKNVKLIELAIKSNREKRRIPVTFE